MSRNKKQQQLRKERNRLKMEKALKSEGRPHTCFLGKVRSGDALEVSFEFTGIQVIYDPLNPGQGLEEQTQLIQDLSSKGDV